MSQAGIISTSSGPVPPAVPTSFPTDDGTAIPAANILNVNGVDSTENNVNGIMTRANPDLSDNLEIVLTNRLTGTGTTVGAVTADLVTFSLGATPGVYHVHADTVGYESTGPAGTAYETFGPVITTGAAATVVLSPDETVVESISLIASDVDFIASGNNLILRVTGVAGLTINWRVVANYVFVS